MATKSDKKKQIIAGALGLILVGVLVYQFFFSGPPPRPTVSNRNGSTPTAQRNTAPVSNPETAERVASKPAASRNDDEAQMQVLLSDMTPLNTVSLREGGNAAVGERGNIFEFYIPPKKPDPPPPPPPPIAVLGLSPNSATAGVPRPFTLTVYCKPIPVTDAQIIIDGRPRPTKYLNEGALSTEIAPADYAYARSMNVEVKSKSDPTKMYSNPMTFTVGQAPEPGFRFIGLLGEQAVIEMGGSKEVMRFKTGQTIQGVWRIDSISLQGIDVTHTQFDIKRRIPLQDRPR